MNLKRLSLATLVAWTAMWVLAGVYHEVLMAHFYAERVHGEHQGLPIILLGYLILGGLLAYLMELGYKGVDPLKTGLRYGVLVGILWVFPHELVMAGAHGESLVYVFGNGLWHVVEQGVGGILIGWVYQRMA